MAKIELSMKDSILLDMFNIFSIFFIYLTSFSIVFLNIFVIQFNPYMVLLLPITITLALLIFQLLVALEVNLFKYSLKEGSFKIGSREANKWTLAVMSYSIYRKSFVKAFLDQFFFTRFLFNFYIGARISYLYIQGHEVTINEPWNVSIERGAVLGDYAFITPHLISEGFVHVKKIEIKENSTIGHHSSISPGSIISKESVVLGHSYVKQNTFIPKKQVWGGLPAKFIKNI